MEMDENDQRPSLGELSPKETKLSQKDVQLSPKDDDNLLHYLAVKKLSALSSRMTSKNEDDFYYVYNKKNKLELHKRVCKNKDFCNIIMPSQDTKISEFNQY